MMIHDGSDKATDKVNTRRRKMDQERVLGTIIRLGCVFMEGIQ
jgi:hypothetical protein